MKRSSHHSRRQFLQLGLAGLALPPLASLLGTSNLARASTTGKPARLVTIFFPNGVSLPPESLFEKSENPSNQANLLS